MSLLLLFAGASSGGPAPGPAYGTDDLTTDVSFYLATLLPGDQTTEFRQYVDGVRATTGTRNDINSEIWLDLNF